MLKEPIFDNIYNDLSNVYDQVITSTEIIFNRKGAITNIKIQKAMTLLNNVVIDTIPDSFIPPFDVIFPLFISTNVVVGRVCFRTDGKIITLIEESYRG